MRKFIWGLLSSKHSRSEPIGQGVAAKYIKSGLTLQEATEIRELIKLAFENDKIYKDSAISLNALSSHINKDRYKVSQVLNEYLSKNFYSLINQYRIAEAKDLLHNQAFLSVKAVMYEVGFNSKTSFYSAFKKETGVSPNDFRALTRTASLAS
ncbi:helix-turn-helix domain-containing protein [Flagellimonas myxillae]|uniref:helix-turn-helix domain-containing protein n=1 Tax=Flagellimonas myxillae TaxID=2942214 RepID=UPI00201F5032|nr:helix-turn-helix domain-containing protein [Muricauda myxillae]MCL6264864.1 helix-turn-helix domain-containing protein [Muricauda myxillae]